MMDYDSNNDDSDAELDLDWRHVGRPKGRDRAKEHVLTESQVNGTAPKMKQSWPGAAGLLQKQRREKHAPQMIPKNIQNLVNLDSDSEPERPTRKGAHKPSAAGPKFVIDLNSSDDDEEGPAKEKPASRLPTVIENRRGWEADKTAPTGPDFKRAAAAWSPPRPELSDGPTGSGGERQEWRRLSDDAKGKRKVGWSDDDDRGMGFEASGEESEEVDLINMTKPVQRRKGGGTVKETAKRQKTGDGDGAKPKGNSGREEETGRMGLEESEGEEGLEGLDEKEKKRRLAERKKRQAAEEKALKVEERERKREEVRQEKERKKLEKQEARKAAAEEKRALKEQEKQQRAEQRDAYRMLSGKEALAHCCVQIDPSLIGRGYLGAMLTLELQTRNYKYECTPNAMPHSITWRRVHFRSKVGTQDEFESQSQRMSESQPDSQVEGEEVDVPYVVLVYTAAAFCDAVRSGALWQTLEQASTLYPGWTVCLLIPELRKYIKQRKADDYKKADVPGHVAWSDPGVDEALARLCVHYDRVRSSTPKDENEATEHIANLTRGHAEAPYKKQSTVVNTFGGGNHLKPSDKARLKNWPWLKGLMLLDGLSINVAEAIKQSYPTLRSLMDAYTDPSLTPQHKAGLLKDLSRTIGFGQGSQPGQESSRRVGPKLSEKVFRFLTARDPELMIEEITD